MEASTVDPNSNVSQLFTIPVSILAAISLILCVLRFWTRIKTTGRFYIDDWLILIAEVRTNILSGPSTVVWFRLMMNRFSHSQMSASPALRQPQDGGVLSRHCRQRNIHKRCTYSSLCKLYGSSRCASCAFRLHAHFSASITTSGGDGLCTFSWGCRSSSRAVGS